MIHATRRLWPVALLMAQIAAYASAEVRADTHISRRIVEVPLTADRPALSPEEAAKVPLSGAWEVAYFDRKLGFVEGEAMIREEDGTAKVVFYHPRTGRKFNLQSRSFSRNGGKVVIEFEGRQPGSEHEDGQRYPQHALVVAEDTGEISVSVGANKATKDINPRKPSDLDTVRVELNIFGRTQMKGRWLYRADPAIKRDRVGYGRVGDFTEDEEGNGQQSGGEAWTRPKPEVLGAFALQSQTGSYRDEPHYPHPYQKDKFRGKQTFRTIFIFGTDLPDGRNNRAVITSEIDGVSYGRVIYPDSTFQFSRGFLKPFKTGKAKLLKRLEQEKTPTSVAEAAIKAFDYLVVEATLSEAVGPGLQPFSVNGSENTWTLMFGNNRADVRFVREIDPKAIPTLKKDTFGYTVKHPDQKDQQVTKGHLEITITDDAPAGDSMFATVQQGQSISGDIYKTKTYTELPDTVERLRRLGVFPRWDPKNVEGSPIVTNPGIRVGRYGTLDLKRDGSFTYKANEVRVDSERFEFTRDAFIPETLHIEVRTELDLGVEVIRVTIGKNGDVEKMGPKRLVAAHRVAGDPRLYRTGAISLVGSRTQGATPTAIGERYTLPVRHEDALMASIAELGLISFMPPPAILNVHTTPARFPLGFSYLWKDHIKRAASCYPELKGIDWDRSNYDYVAEVKKYVHFDWKFLVRIFVPVGALLPPTALTVNFQLGDHVALLMMRQAFNQMLIEKMDELTRKAGSDKETRAFWILMNPYRWNPTEHPITDIEYDIQVTGPRGQKMPFLDTYWDAGLGETRRYDSLDEIPNWIVKATREAIHAYITIMAGSLVFSEKIKTCDVEGLVKLTGNTFENVQKWLNPRLMRLEANSRARTQQWVPDYHARLRVDQIASKFWQVKAFTKIERQDTQHLVMAVGIMTLPIMFVVGGPAVIILGISEVGLEAIVELPKYLESRSEIAFARGTVDVLDYGRRIQAKADEHSFLQYMGRIALVAGAELGAGSAMQFVAGVIAAPIKLTLWAARKGLKSAAPVLQKSLFTFRKGIRYVLARRGQKLFKRHGLNVSNVPSNLKARDYKAMMEYIYEAALRKANLLLDDDQVKILLRLEELAAEAGARPRWARNLDEATHQHLKDLYFRQDIKELMKSAGGIVSAALRRGGRSLDEAMRILRYSAVRTGTRFQNTLKARLERTFEPLGKNFYEMASLTNKEVRKLLRRNKWFINIHPKEGVENAHIISIRDAAGKTDELTRAFDPETGTLSMIAAYRKNIAAHIKVGLPLNLSEKGVPSFLFAQLKYMQKMGIGYAGQGGKVLKKVVMHNITNARTIVQLAWFIRTYHPGKTLAELNDAGILGEFLKHSRSLEYARTVINLAGYQVKSVRLDFEISFNSDLIHAMHGYKVARDGEAWEEFLKRYGLSNNDKGPALFNIDIEVEPHPNAFGRTTARDIDPPITQTPRTPTERLPRTGTERLPRTPTERLPRTGTETHPPARGSSGRGDGSGDPPTGDGPPATPGGGGEPSYMETLAQLRQEAEQQARDALYMYRAHQRGDVQLTSDELNAAMWAIQRRDHLQSGLEHAVSMAQKYGVPDDVIAQQVRDYANGQWVDAIRAIEKAHLEQQGMKVLGFGDTEAEMVNRLVTNMRAGGATAEDLAFLRQRIAAARAQGRDYFDDLARTGHMTPEEPFELLANASEIARLRALANRENLYSGASRTGPDAQSPPTRPQGRTPPSDAASRSLEDTQTMGRPNPSGQTQRIPLEMPPSAEAAMRQRLGSLNPLQVQHALRTAGIMQRLGVPEELARELVALNAVRLANPRTLTLNLVQQSQLIARGILEHGTRRVTLKEFEQSIGLPKILAEVAAEVAARQSGYAPIPGEILPGRMYPQ